MRDEDREYLRLLGAINDNLTALNQTQRSWQEPLHVVIDNPTPPPPPPITATKAVLTYSGDTMATGNLTVDTTTGKVTVSFDDDKGDTDAPAPAGAVAAFSVVPGALGVTPATTVTPDATNPLACDIVPGPEGDSGAIACAFNGTALEADGVTVIADPAPWPFTVTAGAAVSSSLSESQ